MGLNHARLYKQIKNATLVAICDSNAKRARAVSRILRVRSYTSTTSMLEKEKLDAVSVAVPTRDHYKTAAEAIRRGVSVLVEKPLTEDVQSARRLIDLAREKKVVLMVGHLLRFNPAINAMKTTLGRRTIGRVIAACITRIGARPERSKNVGVIQDLAVHDFDLARYLFESEVEDFRVHTKLTENRSFEDYSLITMRMKNGVLVTSENVWSRTGSFSQRSARVIGTKGVAVADLSPPKLTLYTKKGASEPILTGDTLQLELEHFLSCVRNRQKPRASGLDGLIAVQLVRRALELGR